MVDTAGKRRDIQDHKPGRRIMKVRMRTFNVIFQILVAIIMSLFLSFFMIAVNVGFVPMFPLIWLRSFGLSLVVTLPISLVVVPVLRQGLSRIFEIDYTASPRNVFKDAAYVRRRDRVSRVAFAEIYDMIHDWVRETVPSGKILDVGCGTGLCAIQIARNDRYEVAGIDNSAEMIKMCEKNAKKEGVTADFRVATASQLPFEDGEFDMIISNGSLHHWEKPVEVFNEMYRVLKPGGSVFVNDLCKDPDRDELMRIIGSRIPFKPMRNGFMENAPKGAYSRERVLGILEESNFAEIDVKKKVVSLEVRLQKGNCSPSRRFERNL
jgi:ubiquinone/menaquinone biosynthesis C-methylase UbiE